MYFAHTTGQLLSIMDRMFYASGDVFSHKPAAAVVTARKADATSSLDVIAKHFTDNSMPMVSSTYWNMVHGTKPDELEIKQNIKIIRSLSVPKTFSKNRSSLLCLYATSYLIVL